MHALSYFLQTYFLKPTFKKKALLFLGLMISFTPYLLAQSTGVIYVKKGNVGGDGSTWSTAMGEFADALKSAHTLNAANPGTVSQIWVAKGSYMPMYSAADIDFGTTALRNNTFLLVKDVKIYGGFAGSETNLNERDLSLIANKTYLSGDLNGDDQTSGTLTAIADNVNHVVLSVGNVGTALLDGFTIVGGNANVATTITVNNRTIQQNNGAGIYLKNSSPKITNCIISAHTATANDGGSGIYNDNGSPIISNSLISGNTATGNDSGAGMYNSYAASQLINSTLTGNNATGSSSSALYNKLSSPILSNAVVYGNNVGIVDYNIGGGLSNTGYKNPSVAQNNNGTGTEMWSNPGNALTDNNSYATVSNAALLIGGTVRNSNYLYVKDLGFEVPSNAQIRGVELEIRKASSDNNGSNYTRDEDIKLLKDGLVVGTNHGNIGVNWPTTETAFTYGTNADTWGTTLTPEQINSPDFGAAIAITSRAAGLLLPTVISYIDQVRIRVYYQVDAETKVTYSVVQGGFTGPNNLNADPSFVNPSVFTNAPTVAGDYTLAAGSIALNVGDNSANTDAKDLGGMSRTVNTTIDLGPYERQALLQTITGLGPITKTYGDTDFSPAGVASSSLAVSYNSSDPSIALVYVDATDGNKQKIKIVKAGTVNITASQSGNTQYDPAPNIVFALTINKATATLTLGDLTPTYDGTGKAVSVTTDPVGLTGLSITYDGNATLPTSAGTYAVVVSLTNDNYTAVNATSNLIIGKAAATLTLSDLTPTYDGIAKAATATTNPAGLSGVSITYDGNATLPISVGTYAVVASLTNNNYTATNATGNLVIGKATAILTLSDLTPTYDGTAKAATVSTNPAGLSGVSITYNGDATLPTLAGTYAVEASLTNANYTATNVTGNLVIGKAIATLTLSNLTPTYDGTAKAATLTTNPIGLSGLSITYNGNSTAPNLAGTYAVVASLLNDNYTAVNATGNLVIGKATAIITLSNLSQNYDGLSKTVTVTTNPAGLSGLSVTYDGQVTAPSNSGTYAVVANLTNDNYTAVNATGNLVITGGLNQTISFPSLANKTYGDAPFQLNATGGNSGNNVTFSSSNAAIASITGNTVTIHSAGSVTITAAQAGNANYNPAPSVPHTLNIQKAAATLGLSNLNVAFDGTTKSATVTTNPAGLSGVSVTYDGLVTLPTAIGTYTVVASLNNTNYTAANVTGNLVISNLATLSLSNLSFEYDGTAKAATVTTLPAGLTGVTITYNGLATLPSSAGTYAVVASLNNPNYTANNTNATLVITKKVINVSAQDQAKVYGDSDPDFSYVFSPALVAGDNFTGALSRMPGEGVGTYGITQHTLSLNSNYTLNYAGATLSINKKTITVTANTQTKTYGDPNTNLSYSFSPSLATGDRFTGALATAAVGNVGTYAISQNTLALNSNYTLNFVGANLTVVKAPLSIKANDQTKFFGTVNPSLTLSYNGFVLGETSAVLINQPIAATTATQNSATGVYPITVTGAAATNYEINYVAGTLTVGQNSQTITFAPLANKLSTDAVFALTATASSGLAVSYNSSDASIARIINGNQVEILKAGTVNITASQAGNANYFSAVTVSQVLRINDNSAPVIAISSSKGNTISLGETIVLTASGANSYVWTKANGIVSGQQTATLTVRPNANTVYTVTGSNVYGRTTTQTIEISVTNVTEDVTKPTNILSPNGDGVNDFWVVENIELYPNNTVTIVDIAGRPVFKVKGYKNNWDATINGVQLSRGTYYYVVDFGVAGMKSKRGFITILR